jgi:serine protease Do
MRRHLFGAALACALISIPVVAQERVHVPGPGETDEWCATPIVWTGAGQDADSLRRMEAMRKRGYLGVRLGDLTEARAKELGIGDAKGALVMDVLPDSPAAKAGLKANDVVVSVDGRAVASDEELRAAIGEHENGQQVTLEIVRDGKRQTVVATLASALGDFELLDRPGGGEIFRGRLPEGFSFGDPSAMMFPGQPRLGVSILPMTDELREYFGVERGTGVLVSAVSKGSAAERAGLRAGDVLVSVDGQPVAQTGDVARALRGTEGSDAPRTVRVEIVRDRSRQTLSATVEAPKVMNEE